MKKRFDSSSLPEPPERLVFFVDRCLGRRIVTDLRAAGAEAQVHDDHFPSESEDVHWLAEVGRRGWIVLTRDVMIRHRILERQALLAAGVRAFILTSGNLRGEEMSAIFVQNLARISKMAAEIPPPFIAKITRSQVIECYRDLPLAGSVTPDNQDEG